MKDTGYPASPEQVQLLPGAARAVRMLREAGFRIVVVTNQSGVARGLLTELDLAAVNDRLRELLADEGAHIDALYYCPYHPEGTVAAYRRESTWRKPNPGMLLQAAEDLCIDLSRSWMVGDSVRDVVAGRRAGCRTILLTAEAEVDCPEADFTAADVLEAAEIILKATRKDKIASQKRNCL